MLPDPFEADPGQLRVAGARVLVTADRVTAAATQAPPLVVTAPGWAATAAAGNLERAAAALFGALGADIDTAAGGLRAAADRYEQADVRAAARFRAGTPLTGPFLNRPPPAGPAAPAGPAGFAGPVRAVPPGRCGRW